MAFHRTFYKKYIILFFLLIGIFFQFTALATVKKIGVPLIQNFERSEYNAGTQNWCIEQGRNGVMYFSNNQGLLGYDGKFWDLYSVPNKSNIRTVYFSEEKQKLYVGAFNEIGYFTNDSIGSTEYISLLPLIPIEFRTFGDTWKIYEGPWGIVFQSFQSLLFYKDDKIEVVLPRSIFHFSYYINGTYYVFDRDNGLMEYRNGFLKKIPDGDLFANKEIWSILSLNNDEILVGTATEGMFKYDGLNFEPWNVPVNELLQKYQIYSSLKIDEDHFAFGTIQNGLIICNMDGVTEQIINREKGLQNNTILSMKLDLDGNIWLGLDNGIDYIEINSPVSLLQDFYDFGTGYTSIVYKENIYLGTNQGLFMCSLEDFGKPDLSSINFKMVENSSGQVWSLQIINNQLFCGHNNGSFLIVNDKAQQISEIPGGWAYSKIPGYSDLYLQGTYNGLELCKFENGTINHISSILGINYSCQEVACFDDRFVWVSHAFNGVKLFRLNSNLDSLVLVKIFEKEDGLPSNYFNELKQMRNGDLLLTTPSGIYIYNESEMNFSKSDYYNNLFQNKTVQYLQEDENLNIWYVTNNSEGGVLRHIEDGTYSDVYYPFNKLKGRFIGSFFNFNAIDESNVLIALEKGFAHYNPKLKIDYQRDFKAILNTVSLLNTGEVLCKGIMHGSTSNVEKIQPEVDYRNNSLRFTFTGLFYDGKNEVQFSYQLNGFDDDWSHWQEESTKEYTNLPDGEYSFQVKVKNNYGVIANTVPFEFTVLPPWYKSLSAIISYFIFFIVLIWLIVIVLINRIKKTRLKELDKQKQLFREKEEHLKREALEAEKEIIRLRNEKLKISMVHKGKELANTAINLVQKNKQLNKIKADLKKINDGLKDDLIKGRINMMIRKIEKETNNDESWSIFETNFEQVHEDFLLRIRNKHSKITPKELKLVAYLRMNISSKEIAELMNITTRGVEISRYRLRRKFELDRSQNLIDYILSI